MPSGWARRAALLLVALAAPAVAQTPATPPSPTAPGAIPPPQPGDVDVTLHTSAGDIVVELARTAAPITTSNFLRYVDEKRLDGTSFYRAVKVQPGFGLVQGGTRNDPKRTLPPIKHEPTTLTHLTHSSGTISMARAAPGTASGDFFITVGDMPSMDAQPGQPGDNLGFAAFGHVVAGMDVVRQILDAPTSPTAGGADMKGQILAQPVTILTARRTG